MPASWVQEGGNTVPSITTINPATGPLTGGNPVTIYGGGFLPSATVAFGVNVVTQTSVSGDGQAVSCLAPNYAYGAVDVTVANPANHLATLTNGYRLRCFVAACACFSANAYVVAADDSEQQGKEQKLVIKSAEVNGVRLEISVPKRTAAEQPLPVRIRIENRSDAAVLCGDAGGSPDCHVSVTDISTGLACPITPTGKNYVAGWPLSGRVSYGLGKVAPGTSKSWNRLDLARWFTLTPGTYRLDYTLNCNIVEPKKKFDVPLTGLQFEIVP